MGILLLARAVLPGCGTPTIHLTRSAPGPATHGGKVQESMIWATAIRWKSTATGEMLDLPNLITDGLAGQAMMGASHAFVPSAKTVVSVHAALAKAFETVPDLTQRAFPRWLCCVP